MAWGSTWDDVDLKDDTQVVNLAKKCYKIGSDWEAEARIRFDYDYKFANGDTHNKYQWDTTLVNQRIDLDKPCLTINKTAQHNLMIINDAKQNKPGIRIRPVNDEASFEAAQAYQELIYHTEYISSAENVYDSAISWQVQAGIGYWRLACDYVDDVSFDQEVYIRRIKDPRSVFLDPDIVEQDGLDARWGLVFEDMPRDLYQAKYPKNKDVGGSGVLGNTSADGWITTNIVRVAEFFHKEEEEDKLVTFIEQSEGKQVIARYSLLSDEGKATFKSLKDDPNTKERRIVSNNIKWWKIAGDQVIDKGDWIGKYIPIIRCPGVETVIDGQLDRKGHTRALINAQQIYNYNTSANVEYGALQTKSPWVAPADAVENFEEYWESANTKNHSYLPYNHIGDDGKPIPPPTRPAAPQASPAYIEGLKIAQNEMMMASGQYQAQFGEEENAKSGVAINARQRQGDRATYHFLDNQAIAIRATGKQLLDIYPKLYDTKRVKKIIARDNKKLNITIDPEAKEAFQKPDNPNPETDPAKRIEEIIFNPKVGTYDVQSDVGPSFATKRMDAFNALTQIAAQNKDFMQIGGDLFFKVADFPEAEVLAQRYERIIAPNVKGEGPDPQTEQLMNQASARIEQLTGLLSEAEQKLKDRAKEFEIKEHELELRFKEATTREARADYEAENKRMVALGNSGPAINPAIIAPVVKQLIIGMLNAGEPGAGDRIAEQLDKVPIPSPPPEVNGAASPGQEQAIEGEEGEEEPPVEGAEKGPDNNWYVKHGNQYYRVEASA